MLCIGSNLCFLSLFVLDEPKYWWFELMILLNKTMMCGGLVVLAPGSPLQVLFAILIMLFHLLFVLKLAPYVKDSEDWSAFLSTLGLCLLSLGAYSMMIELDPDQMEIIGVVTTVLPLLCIAVVFCIIVFVDGGLWRRLCGERKSTSKKNTNGKASATQVQPIDRKNNDKEKQENLDFKNWGRNN